MNTRIKNGIERIAGMTYGVEIEYTGVRRGTMARAVAERRRTGGNGAGPE